MRKITRKVGWQKPSGTKRERRGWNEPYGFEEIPSKKYWSPRKKAADKNKLV